MTGWLLASSTSVHVAKSDDCWRVPLNQTIVRLPPFCSRTKEETRYIGGVAAVAALIHTAKARAAYQDFLTLWKDADPDIPILKEARAEYAKLQ